MNTIINFVDYADSHDEMAAAYIPGTGDIEVYIHPDASFNTIEALIQHELIHYAQDQKSGMKMAREEINRLKKYKETEKEIKKAKIDCYNQHHKLCDKLEDLETERRFLNHQEFMTYAYMFVKLRKNDNMKETLKEAGDWWKRMTGKKMSKRMLKYFYSYWMVKDEL